MLSKLNPVFEKKGGEGKERIEKALNKFAAENKVDSVKSLWTDRTYGQFSSIIDATFSTLHANQGGYHQKFKPNAFLTGSEEEKKKCRFFVFFKT